MGEYTALTLVSVVLVVLYELLWARTGIFRDLRYWITMGICYAFMIPVNGWFTKLSAPIVLYDPDRFSGIRIPWDIPVEDFVFGFSMLTAVLIRWKALDRTRPAGGDVGPARAAVAPDEGAR